MNCSDIYGAIMSAIVTCLLWLGLTMWVIYVWKVALPRLAEWSKGVIRKL